MGSFQVVRLKRDHVCKTLGNMPGTHGGGGWGMCVCARAPRARAITAFGAVVSLAAFIKGPGEPDL